MIGGVGRSSRSKKELEFTNILYKFFLTLPFWKKMYLYIPSPTNMLSDMAQ